MITNMVRDERRELIHQRLEAFDFQFLTDIPFDAELEQAVFDNKPLAELDDTPAVKAVDEILDTITSA